MGGAAVAVGVARNVAGRQLRRGDRRRHRPPERSGPTGTTGCGDARSSSSDQARVRPPRPAEPGCRRAVVGVSGSGRAYLDRPVTDRGAATAAAVRAATHWGLAEPELLRVGMNAIFACGDEVLRVGVPNAPATVSLELAGFLAEMGLRVPGPTRDDVVEFDSARHTYAVTCWERLRPSTEPTDWR